MGYGIKAGRGWLALGLAGALLGGCAEVQFVMQTAKTIEGQPKGGAETSGAYKVGKPYQIAGVWYYPQEEWDYDETGIASWYGPQFHGKATANGETYDMNAMTAAHRTLPMPSYVRVTNLENGRSITLRINDRGPFARGRIIDVSRRGAQLLGFENQGTAKVRVQIMADESREIASRMQNQQIAARGGTPIQAEAMPKPPVSAEHIAPPPGGGSSIQPDEIRTFPSASVVTEASATPSPAQESVSILPVGMTRMFVQAGAYAYYDNANRVRAALSGLGPVEVSPVLVNGKDVFRVRVGPLSSIEEADRALDAAIQAGYPDARTIVEN